MDAVFWFCFLLISFTIKGSTGKESCVSQPDKMLWVKTGQSVLLQCNISPKCKSRGMRYEWFSFKEDSHLCLNVSQNSGRYWLKGASLHIESLQASDSGIYHCAAMSEEPGQGKQHVALGTTLVVRENVRVMVMIVLLSISIVLLAIYSLVVLTLMIKKAGCSVGCFRGIHKSHKSNSTKKRQFRDVLQEIHRRNNMGRNKQAAAETDGNNSADDIYQNV